MQIIIGQIFALLTAACWAQNSVVYSFAGKRIGSSTVTHLRLWVALPAIVIIHFLFLGQFFPHDLSRVGLLYLGASGLVGFFLADLFLFKSFVELGPRETLVIMTLSPIFSTLISWIFLDEILSLMQLSGILITVGGVAWVVFVEGSDKKNRNRRYALGVLFALSGSFAQALGMVLAKGGIVQQVHPVSANLVRIITGLIGLIFFALLRGEFINDFRKTRDRKALLLLSMGALVGPVLGIILTLYAFQWAPVGVVTALMQTSPILLLPVDYFIFKKTVPPSAVFGTLAAIGGAALLFVAP